MARSTAAAAVGLALFLILAATASASPPAISYSVDGISGSNGWYRGSTHGDNVILHWSVSLDAESSSCLPAITISGPTTGTSQTCWAANADGTTTAVTRVIKIDAAPPTGVTASFSRRPDYNGWYNHPVAISWSGSDATSGIASCSSVTYQGPYNGAATVTGGCTDAAGNTAALVVHLAYDATPPALRNVMERSTGATDVLHWSSSSASDRVVVSRTLRGRKVHTTVFDGIASGFADKRIRPGAEYRYSVRSFDQAGNPSSVISIAGLPKVLTLHKTRYVPRAAPNPILRWRRVHGAGYYNVQLYRNSKRIYASWPKTEQIGLSTTWKWSGRRFRLTPGRYRWYVWAGVGPRTLARYRTVGSASFVLPHA